MIPRLKDIYLKEIQPALKSQFGYKNTNMGPKIEKVILMDRKKISKMESKGHYFIKKNFDKKVINKKFVKLINEINRV